MFRSRRAERETRPPGVCSLKAAHPRAARLLRRLSRAFVAASVGLTILTLLVYLTPLVPWYARALSGPWNDPDGDILIVLSSESEPGDIIGLESYWRSVYAIRAWRAGHFRTVVVSGGHTPNGERSMAAVIGQFLASNGIPKDRIFLEQRAASTRENALFTGQLIAGWAGRRVLLTSDYHMFRARRAFEAAGVPVTPLPFPDILKRATGIQERGSCFWALCVETLKIAFYWHRD